MENISWSLEAAEIKLLCWYSPVGMLLFHQAFLFDIEKQTSSNSVP